MYFGIHLQSPEFVRLRKRSGSAIRFPYAARVGAIRCMIVI